VILGPGSTSSGLLVSTALGTHIPNEQRSQRPSQAMAAAKSHWTATLPNIEHRSSRSTYNCMGLPFAARRTAIDPQHVRLILAEDGYSQLPGLDHVVLGDLVLYYDSEGDLQHIGVVYERYRLMTNVGTPTGSWRTKVLSQWGFDGEYVHQIEDVPTAFGFPAEYWTDRL